MFYEHCAKWQTPCEHSLSFGMQYGKCISKLNIYLCSKMLVPKIMQVLCEIWGSDGGDCEDRCFLWCYTM